jgi:hypothetical protein
MRNPDLMVSTVLTLLIAFLVSGCVLDGRKNEARISNESGVAVEILWTAPGAEDIHYKDIPPGQVAGVFEWVASCAPSAMVARTANGQELARTDGALCPGDFWVISAPGSPLPS